MNKGAWLYGIDDLRGEEEGHGGDLARRVYPCLSLLRRIYNADLRPFSPSYYFLAFHNITVVVENYDTSRPLKQKEVRVKLGATGICGR